MRSNSPDVCVIGGGPAGSSAALRLARLGYRVVVVDRGDGDVAGREESVAPSITPLFDSFGLSPALSGLLRLARKRSIWVGDAAGYEDEVLLIERRSFDRALRAAAAGAGVEILRPATAGRPVATGTGWSVAVETQSGRASLAARFIIDARGRCGSGSRFGMPTVALRGTWCADRAPEMPEMLVETVSDGWIWTATRLDGSVRALAFVDTQVCAGLRRPARERFYRAMLAGSTLLGEYRLTHLLGDVTAQDSTWRVGDQIVTACSIKVGDRAFAMDPLSSQGVQSALRAGIQAGAVIHTILSGGGAEAAIQFYREAQDMAIASHRRALDAAFAAQRIHQSAFWTKRAPGNEPDPAPPASVVTVERQAIVRLADDARIVDVPAIVGDAISWQPALAHPSLDRPVAWLSGAPIAEIVRAIRSRTTVSDLLSECSVRMTPASAHAAISWLLAHGIVSVRDQTSNDAGRAL